MRETAGRFGCSEEVRGCRAGGDGDGLCSGFLGEGLDPMGCGGMESGFGS